MADGRFELVMEPTAIRLGSLNSNPETHMTSICDARLIYGRGWSSRVFMWWVALTLHSQNFPVEVPQTLPLLAALNGAGVHYIFYENSCLSKN